MAERKRTRKTTQNKKKSPAQTSPFAREIAFVIVILLSILMLLSFFGLSGIVGKVISNIIFGLFGFLAYLFPIMLLAGGGLWLSNPNNKRVRKKVIFSGLLYFVLTSIFQWMMNESVPNVTKYYAISSEERIGGGLLGGTVSFLLERVFGRVGSLLVMITLIIILFILLSKKMLFSSVRELFEEDEEAALEKEKLLYEQAMSKKSEKKMSTYKFPKEEPEREPVKEKKRRRGREKTLEPKQEVKAKEEVKPEISIIRPEEPEVVPIFQEEMDQKFGAKEQEVSVSAPKELEPKKIEVMKPKEEEAFHKQMDEATKTQQIDYQFPSLDLLNMPKRGGTKTSDKELIDIATKLQDTLESFGVRVKMGDVSCGPSVTRFEMSPEQGVKVASITRLADDIKLSLAASDIRIEAPIPGKAAVGIEVPNENKTMVTLRELLESQEFAVAKSKISFAVGKDIGGKTIVTDVAKMPHMLVAGATGSGKSVCINTLIMSILYKAHPDEVKLILIDPKVVEFSVYNEIPHLMIPVVTDPKKASAALNWAVAEMTKRYQKFAEIGVRDMGGYNKRIDKMTVTDAENYERMPQIVIIVDEFADLMMVAPGEVEDAVCRLAQLARAAGIHLVLATQRPSVNVITGLIKANIPSRIALSVSSAIDSRTIIDSGGAEKLLGNGDMLFAPGDYPKPVRIQGAYVSDKEVRNVVEFLKDQYESPTYNPEVAAHIEAAPTPGVASGIAGGQGNDGARDELFYEVAKLIIEKDKASIGMLQRAFRIGFNRAARIMDQLCDAGIVGPEEGTKPRTILMSEEQFENFLEEQG